MSTDITLYTYPTSPYGLKVACYLEYKNLDYHFVPVNPVTNRQIRFTRQRQVPVLKINGEWRKESSALGIWLDELFPERPLLGQSQKERQRILEIDSWISHSFIPSVFREVYEWESARKAIANGRRLSSIVHNATSIPMPIRVLWPLILRRVGFIVRLMDMVDLEEPIADMRRRLAGDLLEHLGDGPYLGGLSQPSLADLSIYPIILFGVMSGIQEFPGNNDPALAEWGRAVQKHLPNNPLLAPDNLLENKNPFLRKPRQN